jgi:hypothetical protein
MDLRPRGGEGLTPSLRRCLKDGERRNNSGLERETGLEPATPCLEGTAPSCHIEKN